MTDKIIFARVSTRKSIVKDIEEYMHMVVVMNGYCRSVDSEMRIAREEENLVAMGWSQRYVDGLGIIYIDRLYKHRKGAA